MLVAEPNGGLSLPNFLAASLTIKCTAIWFKNFVGARRASLVCSVNVAIVQMNDGVAARAAPSDEGRCGLYNASTPSAFHQSSLAECSVECRTRLLPLFVMIEVGRGAD